MRVVRVALLFTLGLALGTLASTGDEEPSGECPPDGYLPFGDTKIEIHKIAEGTEGCVYKLVGGWNGLPAVAKVPLRSDQQALSELELQGLTRVKQLYATGLDETGKQWVIMATVPGNKIFDTTEWKNVIGKKWFLEDDSDEERVKACVVLTQKVDAAVRSEVQRNVIECGALHKGMQVACREPRNA
ncbi:hypothetical protein FRB99_007388 [Tulasnella sp. 403]|nr:hypothetical protein FRB99_007388 [Tulasnella sp. 403]